VGRSDAASGWGALCWTPGLARAGLKGALCEALHLEEDVPSLCTSGGPPPAGAPSSSHPTWSGIEEIRGDGRTSSNTLTIKML
jgi:hypothetical protein